MQERPIVPLLIGLIGKRLLAGRERTISAALAEAYDRIDADCPHSPKVLMTALAAGSDTLAAEKALERENWTVQAVLPLAAGLYEQDFAADGGPDCELERFRHLLAHPKVSVQTLDPLRNAETGEPFTDSELARSTTEINPDRTEHYEQCGLYIADRCALLIAVMPIDEKPDKVGGTARIVNARLRGVIDVKGADVVGRSVHLSRESQLEPPPEGLLWVVDPEAVTATGAQLVTLDRKPHAQSAKSEEERGKSLLFLRRIDEFNRRILTIPEHEWQSNVEARAADRLINSSDGVLLRQRLAMSLLQTEAKRCVERSVVLLGVFFFLALVSFEFFVVFAPESLLAGLFYFMPALLAISVYLLARRFRWSTYAEDYRAVSEAIRVQLAWWDAGLRTADDHVSRFYMRTATGSRTLIRAAVSALVNAAVTIKGPPQSAPDLDAVENGWLREQLRFFKQRSHARHNRLRAIEVCSWAFFLMALGIGGFLVFRTISTNWLGTDASRVALETFAGMAGMALPVVSVLLAASAYYLLKRHVHNLYWLSIAAPLLVFTLGFLLALYVYVTMGSHHHDVSHAQHGLALTSIALTGLAGVMRYIAEKLSWEAEARKYDEACALFEYAEERLKAVRNLGSDGDAERRRIVRDLGTEALVENETWIRAHRERPLEPVLGG